MARALNDRKTRLICLCGRRIPATHIEWSACVPDSINKLMKGDELVEAYCVKCKAKKEMNNPTAITMKNGKPATTGTCSTCGTKMFKIGK